MTPKILIIVEGGLIQNIIANMPVQIAKIDYDIPEAGDEDDNSPFRGVSDADEFAKDGEFHQKISDNVYPLTPLEQEAKDELKRIHF